MARLSHKDKVRMARRMLTRWERIAGTPIFQSIGWQARKAAIAARVSGVKPSDKKPIELGLRWFERWIPLHILHMRGYKLAWYQYAFMQTLRVIHYLFFRRSKNMSITIKAA